MTTHLAMEQTVLPPALAALPDGEHATMAADFTTVLDGGRLGQLAVLYVTAPTHSLRRQVFARYARLAPGEAFTLLDINNHDLEPLRHEFEATHPGAYTWDCLHTGPLQWQVRIGRVTSDDCLSHHRNRDQQPAHRRPLEHCRAASAVRHAGPHQPRPRSDPERAVLHRTAHDRATGDPGTASVKLSRV
ncbi:DUF2249 domain-containing protein [Streptomyces shenzhenensis]|uniref:DUF2249 domain-containing protein n=1 Tax=Streptomyces shenzhenensis TaxID=943815 RepID=UPI0015F022A0|nr:DUF2249 domain-containing protein [Streptomyces shenzhenensis]